MSLFFERVADYLDAHKDKIALEAHERTFREIEGYREGGMPKAESLNAILRLLNFIISNLRKYDDTVLEEDSALNDLISFEEGIASRRVHYKIDLIDLLHGIRIFRNKLWDYLRKGFREEAIESLDLFKLEKRINTLIVNFNIAVAGMYLASRDALIESQSSSLKKWEEVIKSTSRLDLKIPCKEEFAAIVRAQAEAISRRLHFDEEAVHDVITAVGEACDNAIEHGASEMGIDIHYSITSEELLVEIVDYGKGFDPTGKGDESPDLFAERGRGIFIMRNLVDRVDIKSACGCGAIVTLTKKRVFI